MQSRQHARESFRALVGAAFGATLEIVFGVASSAAPATAQETSRDSVDWVGREANALSWFPSLSADGNVVAFTSLASNLVTSDTNQKLDVFVHDRATGATERVSLDSSGVEGDEDSGGSVGALSTDGQFVAFESSSTNLIAYDNNWCSDIFVRDRNAGVTERVSVDSNKTEADSVSIELAMTPNGRFVAFDSLASNLVANDANSDWDVFVHDRSTRVTERVSVASSGAEADRTSIFPALSDDGRFVAFASYATNLVAGDQNGEPDIFVHDRSTGVTERVSVSSSGAESDNRSDPDHRPGLSADGRLVAFMSGADNLVPNDNNARRDVFVHERTTGRTKRVSVDSSGMQGNGDSGWPQLSSDGRFVVFHGGASNLVANDTNGQYDVFVHELATHVTQRVSVDSSGVEGDFDSLEASISGDGMVVAFRGPADNLVSGDVNGVDDVFVHDFCSTPASWSNYGAGFPGTNGVPTFTSQQNPVFGATITVDVSNSYGSPTIGVIFVGFQRTSIHASWGGDLLVVPALTEAVSFSYGGDSFTGDIPGDWSLFCGVTVDLQAIEADPGAAHGVSFTPGLELVLGK